MAVSGFGDLDLKLASAEVSHPSESTSPEKQTQNSNQNENHNHQNQNLPLSSPENAVLPNLKNESLGEVSGEKTPLPISQKQEEEQQLTQSGTNSSKRGRPRKGSSNELAVVLDPAKNPDWLPAGWKVVTRTRPGGKSAGTKDTYYREPIKDRQFRSKREVLEYLAGGYRTRSQKKQKTNDDAASTLPSGSSGRVKNWYTDPNDIPPKVTWVMGAGGNSWTPFIDGERVPDDVQKQWKTLFQTGAYL